MYSKPCGDVKLCHLCVWDCLRVCRVGVRVCEWLCSVWVRVSMYKCKHEWVYMWVCVGVSELGSVGMWVYECTCEFSWKCMCVCLSYECVCIHVWVSVWCMSTHGHCMFIISTLGLQYVLWNLWETIRHQTLNNGIDIIFFLSTLPLWLGDLQDVLQYPLGQGEVGGYGRVLVWCTSLTIKINTRPHTL